MVTSSLGAAFAAFSEVRHAMPTTKTAKMRAASSAHKASAQKLSVLKLRNLQRPPTLFQISGRGNSQIPLTKLGQSEHIKAALRRAADFPLLPRLPGKTLEKPQEV